MISHNTHKEELRDMLSHSFEQRDIMKRNNNLQAWEIYINGSCVRKTYSRKKAIDLAQKWCGELFEQRKTEVVDTNTGEVIYQIN